MPFQWLKRSVVEVFGRKRINSLTEPYRAWQGHRQTKMFLARLPKVDLCINLGCGYRPMEGWINLDQARGPKVQVVWNLTHGLPFSNSSATAIFSEHLIEHISKEDACKLLSECHRVLQREGVLRLSTPDAERFLRSYAGDRRFLEHPGFAQAIDTPLDRINYMMREYGHHRWSYDQETLALMMRRAGFGSVICQDFGISAHPMMSNIDFETRAFESLYIEGIK